MTKRCTILHTNSGSKITELSANTQESLLSFLQKRKIILIFHKRNTFLLLNRKQSTIEANILYFNNLKDLIAQTKPIHAVFWRKNVKTILCCKTCF